MNAEILVVIVTYNGMEWIERCTGSVLSSQMPADIMVIDNGSTDGTPEWLERHGIEVMRNESNAGFGAANNIGMLRAVQQGYAFVYLLNQDAWVRPDTFKLLSDAFASGSYGILSPIQYDGGGRKMDRQFSKRCKRYLSKSSEAVVQVPFVMAAHWMISRGCLLKTGGFSPAFRQYGEDDNYIDRALWMGFRTGVVRAAEAVHDRASRPESSDKRMFLKCNGSVVRVSRPAGGAFLRLLWETLRLAGTGCVNFSAAPFRFIPTLWKRYPELMRYRRKSRRKGAFLLPQSKGR